jgi:hypothetical protein
MNLQSIKLALVILDSLKVNANEATPMHETKDSKYKGAFAGFLEKAIERGREPRLPGDNNAKKTRGNYPGWLERFRNQLMSFGIPLKEMSLSREALPDLKKVLIAEGYSESEITGLFKKLLHGKTSQEINVTELLERLAESKALFDKKFQDAFLEVSAVPYLEASLCRLGLDHQEANRAIERARTEGGQLDLKRLVRNLKGILRGLPEANQPGADGRAAEDIKGMLIRAGIVDKATNIDGPLSLDRFVQILEQKVASLMPPRLSETQIENHVNDLLGNVLVPARQKGGRSSIESLCANKLKALPDDDSKANPGFKQIAAGWKQSASQGKSGAANAQGTPEFQGKGAGAGAEKTAKFQGKEDELLSKMQELIEAVQGERGNKAIDHDKVTSLHSLREAMTVDRGHAPEGVMKQGARPLPYYVVNQVARQISLSAQRGENHIRLQLRPPQLGAVQIDMDMKDSVLKIGMTTEHNSVKEILVSNIQELRDTLAQHGVKPERIDVQVNYNLGQSMAQAQKDLRHAHSWKHSARTASAISENELDSTETPWRHIRSDALLDMFA